MSVSAEELIRFWFSDVAKEHWFYMSPSFDAMVTEKYAHLLDNQVIFDENPLATIILYDQISRHVQRHRKLSKSGLHDAIALQTYRASGLENRLHELPEMHIRFALMPLRHTFSKPNLEKCLELAKRHNLCPRFIKATLQALAKINNNDELLFIDHREDEDLSYILDNTVYQTGDATFMPKQFMSFLPKDLPPVLAISVSGGVDSMVCLHIAATHLLNTKVVAISINYGNRPEQLDELRMVNRYCVKRGIPHYVRHITEMQRPTDSKWRPFYEAFTKDIRFATYAKIGYPVVLGHNQDDCLENVFSNMKKGINLGNLFGMEYVTRHNDVTVLRPLLSTPKKDIFAYAQTHRIPFALDSTPAMCERGLLRDQLMPVLQNLGLLPGIINTVKNFNQIYEVYENSLPEIEWHNNYCVFPLIKNPGFDYLKRILSLIAETWKIGYVSNRSIGHLLSQIGNPANNLIVLSCKLQARVCKNGLQVYCV